MTRPLLVIFAAIALDAMGIGLIFPILPRLIEDVTRARDVASTIGILTALYAAMQFVFAPVLGALSDRLGRRPVLLISLGGAALDYVLMALAPSLALLVIGRAVAGLTSANIPVATAYITDISPEETRARRFGIFNAMFGIGFVLGPVSGGVLGDYWLRLPFFAAAALNAANLLLAWFVLPESRTPGHQTIDRAALNPLRPLRWALSMRSLLPVIAIFFVLSATGEVYGVCWALWGHDVFGWNGLWIGLSLGTFGVCQSLAQAFLPGPAVRLLGERGTVLTGIAGACVALTVMAFATRPWIVFAIMPVVALAGIATPALQALATRLVDDERQGRFQGVLASAMSLASIVGPLLFSTIYFAVRDHWPGAIWLSALAVNAMAVPLVTGLRFQSAAFADARQ
ncbi:TCR/Tet family MFS transporter [Nguyenibacter vanlangensis]|uniref:TCR/Tet family MFS transporter n=1 Tax=Nguyenibacter vanlangensis TaxID=1216886 RepID=A0A7Y7IVW8_9PROT|nr:TCR/Tet family MFS transporter [Nguyenibacter vanlangensis]NVN11053.1 TCR/Tet family MFS transporter [Nguyenibacter vanlangensis]